MVNTAVILAAGRGSRLGRVSENRSKAMLPVLGVPMIQRVIDDISAAGVTNLFIVSSPRDADLWEYFRGRHNITVLQQDRPLGSGDALKVCADVVHGEFLISACDSIVRAAQIRSLINTHKHKAATVSIGVMRVSKDVSLEARSVVELDSAGRILRFIEKPKPEERPSNITALPLYVCNQAIFKQLEQLKPSIRGEYELPGLFSELCQDPRFVMVGSLINDRLDLTTQADLLELNRIYLRRQCTPVCIDVSARVSPTARIEGPVWIGPRCVIEEQAHVGPGVVLEGDNIVSAGSNIKDALVLRGSLIRGDHSSEVLFNNF
jgi:NDP-sugar pyrophosphorylase family protein